MKQTIKPNDYDKRLAVLSAAVDKIDVLPPF